MQIFPLSKQFKKVLQSAFLKNPEKNTLNIFFIFFFKF